MPDLTEQLSSILSDPAGMEKIKAMAQSLLGSDGEKSIPPSIQMPPEEQKSDLPDIASLAQMAKLFNNRPDDDRVRLLLALRPHLSPEKQLRVDKAVKMLKLLDLAPLLGRFGIFQL